MFMPDNLHDALFEIERLYKSENSAWVMAAEFKNELERLRAELVGMTAAWRNACERGDKAVAEITTLKALLRNVVARYDDYRGRGVSPAPNEYQRVVDAIERIRAALGDEP